MSASDDALAALAAQLRETADAMHAAVRTERALQGTEAGPTPQARTAQHTARIRALLGPEFRSCRASPAQNGAALRAALVARDALLDGDPLAPSAWLSRMALVRPEVDRLASVRAAAETHQRRRHGR